MAPARLLSEEPEDIADFATHKRRKFEIRPTSNHHENVKIGLKGRPACASASKMTAAAEEDEDEVDTAIVPHPYNIRPAGNAYTASRDIKAFSGSFAMLPDELLLQLLEYLQAVDLIRLGSTCKALYAICRAEDLWKTLFIEYVPYQMITYLQFQPAERYIQSSSANTLLLARFLAVNSSSNSCPSPDCPTMHRSL